MSELTIRIVKENFECSKLLPLSKALRFRSEERLTGFFKSIISSRN